MNIAELHQLPGTEKLRIIEILWNDLAEEDVIVSPDWHADELNAAEERLKAGTERVWDWNEAKDYLRSRK